MHRLAAVGVEGQHLVGGELGLGVLLVELPQRLAGAGGVGNHEGQLEGLDGREAPGRVAGAGPHHVGHAVLDLIHQLGRGAAQLHGRVELAGDPPARSLLHLVTPGLQHLLLGRRRRRQEVGNLQGDLLRGDRKGKSQGAENGKVTGFHSTSPLWLTWVYAHAL
jgi:hypothetical protein